MIITIILTDNLQTSTYLMSKIGLHKWQIPILNCQSFVMFIIQISIHPVSSPHVECQCKHHENGRKTELVSIQKFIMNKILNIFIKIAFIKTEARCPECIIVITYTTIDWFISVIRIYLLGL